MAIRCRGLRRAGVVAAVSTVLVTSGIHSAPAKAADADLRVIGGSATSAIVCGNVAVAQDLARQRGIVIQKSKCSAKATGGSVTLKNVDIYASAAQLSEPANPVLRALVGTAVVGVAEDTCQNHRAGANLNECWALGRGGRLTLKKVTLVQHQAGGVTTTRTVDNAVVPLGDGSASARCTNVVNHPLNQRDDCSSTGVGASWSMTGVDAVIRNADGSTSTRRGITVEVKGGAATASVYCFNVTDGSGRVVQINICDGDARGGDATLQNVTIHTG